ncbi:hypothetical protein BGZ95_002339 [Linnemannia exigua]|uniref:Uncharacterized protein n=1 Tax=Linnemannia exigua TaxID=604196 RepID=A0AAD4H308_9FUNG|nr:hypothetical protein BGZ95_002339 [Linnemannia exigua]
MVKITFSLLSIAAVVASVVSASPCAQDTFERFDAYRGDNECVVRGSILEYQTFEIKSWNLGSIVSRERNGDLVVAGISGSDVLEKLEFCVVSSEGECNPPFATHCIYENVEYRVRVNGPIKGYLRVIGGEVIIVPNFLEATGLNLQMISDNAALRIGYKDMSGRTQVFSSPRAGNPIVVEEAVPNKVSQWVELKRTPSYKGRFNLW